MLDIIATTQNKKYKYIKSLKQKKVRDENCVYTVEGRKSVCDAISADSDICLVAMSESYYGEYGPVQSDFVVVKDELFSGLCDTKTPQGIIAVIKKRDNVIEIKPNGLYIYCDNVSDPGNLGTIIRTADAAGFDGVLLSMGCCDVYSPKTVRSSMGSFFNITISSDFSYERLFQLKNNNYNLVCGALTDDAKNYTENDFKKPTVIVVGNEANGVSDDILRECHHIIIPIYGKAESLNVAVATAILAYEARRQQGGLR